MTVGRMKFAFRVAGAMVISAVLSATAGCESNAFKQGAIPPRADSLVSVLRSPTNGLIYPPYLRVEPTTVEEVAAAVETEKSLGETPEISSSSTRVTAFRGEALEVSPLFGRLWLSSLDAAGAGVLNERDAAALKGMRQPGGYYQDPGRGATSVRGRLADTEAALRVLSQLRSSPSQDGEKTVQWATSTCTDVADFQSAVYCANIFTELGKRWKSPASIAGERSPQQPDPHSAGEQRAKALDAAYWYVQWEKMQHVAPRLTQGNWKKLLRANAKSVSFTELQHLTQVAIGVGVPAADLSQVRARLNRDRLLDGSFRDPNNYQGDVTSTFNLMTLMKSRGMSTQDSALAKSVQRAISNPRIDAATRVVGRAAEVLSGGPPNTEQSNSDCQNAAQSAGTVTGKTVLGWQTIAQACRFLGTPISVPLPMTSWDTRSADGLAAAATLVVTYFSNGQRREAASAYRRLPPLHDWVRHPGRSSSLRDQSSILQAYLDFGGRLTAAERGSIENSMTTLRGCPDLPDLYRADAVASCDLPTTQAAEHALRMLSQRTPTSDRN